MDNLDLQTQDVLFYLQRGFKFGLFDVASPSGGRYYFENGQVVKSEILWEAIRDFYNLEKNHGMTLKQICPNYIGEFRYKATAHNWKKNRERLFKIF